MERRPGTQDISWLLDLDRNGQLDLDPPYQRRSVWTAKDRRFFLDTIFRNYPSPAIFLHKHISDGGGVKYYVVDGKQRLETILNFSKGKIRISPEYGDVRLNNKKFSEIAGDVDLKARFWNYQVPVEMIDFREAELVKNVFDRLNRNSRKLTAQELRHAKFEGWFITKAEGEADQEVWKTLGVATRARATRMMDVQFISELMAVVVNGEVRGFSQDELDDIYADLEDLDDKPDFNVEEFEQKFEYSKNILLEMQNLNESITKIARTSTAIYSLWSVVVCAEILPAVNILADRYAAFMQKVQELNEQSAVPGVVAEEAAEQEGGSENAAAARYRENARGASTELTQRQARHDALLSVLVTQ